MKLLKNLREKWAICLVFSFGLFILVWLSEMFRLMIMDISPNPYTLGNILYFFLMVFVVVPFCLFSLWLINPFVVKKLLKSLGMSEESEEDKAQNEKQLSTSETEPNEFLELVEKYSDVMTEKDLEAFLDRRLDFFGKFFLWLVASVVTIGISAWSIRLVFDLASVFGVIAAVLTIITIVLLVEIYRRIRKIRDEERRGEGSNKKGRKKEVSGIVA